MDLVEKVSAEVDKAVVGQKEAVEGILTALVARGHVLLEGVPGVAKTLVANATSRALGLDFARVQFTPDMLPSDLTGTMTLRGRDLAFRPGPVFTNLLLADEINRTPPKTQAALLEAMQEAQVSAEGEPRPLPDPFLVVATQNPIEYEGTYPLPEAQLDRFLLRIELGYPSEEEEMAVLEVGNMDAAGTAQALKRVVTKKDIADARKAVAAVTVSEEVEAFVVSLVRKTRELPSVSLGASPRAAVHLLAAARAKAWMAGRDFVTPDDVVESAPDVLAHRLILSPDAELERYSPRDAVGAALGAVPVPR